MNIFLNANEDILKIFNMSIYLRESKSTSLFPYQTESQRQVVFSWVGAKIMLGVLGGEHVSILQRHTIYTTLFLVQEALPACARNNQCIIMYHERSFEILSIPQPTIW
jgi:hypothetical protein